MLRKNPIEKVEIVEPPLKELTATGHTWRRSCLVGIFSIILFVAAIFGAVRLYVGSGPVVIKSVPTNFPNDVPLYAKDSIVRVTYLTGHYKSHAIAIASFIPKLVLSPLFYNLNDGAPSDNTKSDWQTAQNLWQFLTTSVPDSRDTVRVEWSNLDADPQFIANYYVTELKKAGYQISDDQSTNGTRQFSFSKNAAVGTLYLHPDNDKSGSDYAVLTLTITPAP